MNKEETNTEADYILCDIFNTTIDELDCIPIKVVKKLRVLVINKFRLN